MDSDDADESENEPVSNIGTDDEQASEFGGSPGTSIHRNTW
jgi:hypothetical protein